MFYTEGFKLRVIRQLDGHVYIEEPSMDVDCRVRHHEDEDEDEVYSTSVGSLVCRPAAVRVCSFGGCFRVGLYICSLYLCIYNSTNMNRKLIKGRHVVYIRVLYILKYCSASNTNGAESKYFKPKILRSISCNVVLDGE